MNAGDRPSFWERGPTIDWPWAGFEPAPMDGVTEHATWFGPADRPLFGWVTLPATRSSSLGVVLCPPLGEEARSAHRAFRRLGVELARRGIVALRVDYDGLGDSAGGQHDPRRVAAWQASVVAAVQELRSMGVPAVAGVGMRIGATLAAAAAHAAEFTSLVLWDPCASGRRFLREGAALQQLSGFHLGPIEDGAVETPGFAYDAATVADLNKLKLAALPTGAACARTLVLTRNGKPVAGMSEAETAGRVEWGEATNQQQLVGVEPNEARTPHDVIERVADWLKPATTESATPFTLEPRIEAVLTDARSGELIRERIVELGPNRLFGIVSEPLNPSPTSPWVGLVNVAIESHIGPGRRWVDYSRSWAALGMRCVRFDQGGLGNSPVRPGQAEDRIFDPLWLEDVPDVVDALSTEGAPVALFGLCSGAYSAFEAAMRREFDALYCVSVSFGSPYFSKGHPAYATQRIAARKFPGLLARVFHHNTRLAFALWRIFYQLAPWNAPMSVVHKALKRAGTIRAISNRHDSWPFREAVWWNVVGWVSMARRRRFELQVEPELEHALMTQWSQDVVYADATAFWLRHYGLQAPADHEYVGLQPRLSGAAQSAERTHRGLDQ